MRIFHREHRLPYDPKNQEPAVRKSICTGEMTAGLIDKNSGKFHELTLLQDQKELEAFCRQMGVEQFKTVY